MTLVHGLSLEDRPAAQWPGWRGSASVPGGASQPCLSPADSLADSLAVPELNPTAAPLSPASGMSSCPGIQRPDPSVLDCVLRSVGAGPWPCPRTLAFCPRQLGSEASFPFSVPAQPRAVAPGCCSLQLAVATPDPTSPRQPHPSLPGK